MDIKFNENRVHVNDADFLYDVQKEFDLPTEASEWDVDSLDGDFNDDAIKEMKHSLEDDKENVDNIIGTCTAGNQNQDDRATHEQIFAIQTIQHLYDNESIEEDIVSMEEFQGDEEDGGYSSDFGEGDTASNHSENP